MASREEWWLEEGMAVHGHVVERFVGGLTGGDLRYDVRAPDGTPATLVAGRPLGDRRERWRSRRLAARRAALEHPAMVRIHAVSELAGRPLVITDPYPEYTLGDLLAAGERFSPDRLVAMLAPVAEALDGAHRAGLVHQALSSHSLWLAGDDELLLDTFGVLGSVGAWGTGEGEVRYRSPEQLWGEPLVAASNVYSLAAIIEHALTGDLPFAGDRAAVIYPHLVEEPRKLSDRAPEIARPIDAVTQKGMATHPAERHASAAALVAEAAKALGVRNGHPANALSTGRSRAALRHGRARRRPVAFVAAAIVCGAVAGLVVTPFAPDRPPAPARPAYADAWKQLAAGRADWREALASARSPQAQARAASELAALFARSGSGGEPARLRVAARETGAAYEQLAAAAGAKDRAAYGRAARAVERAEARLSLAASRH